MKENLGGERAEVGQEGVGGEYVRGADDHLPVLGRGGHLVRATDLREAHAYGFQNRNDYLYVLGCIIEHLHSFTQVFLQLL